MCDAEIQYHLWQGNDLERALVVEGDFRHILKCHQQESFKNC